MSGRWVHDVPSLFSLFLVPFGKQMAWHVAFVVIEPCFIVVLDHRLCATIVTTRLTIRSHPQPSPLPPHFNPRWITHRPSSTEPIFSHYLLVFDGLSGNPWSCLINEQMRKSPFPWSARSASQLCNVHHLLHVCARIRRRPTFGCHSSMRTWSRKR